MNTPTEFERQLEQLNRVVMASWWLLCGGLWLTVGLLSLWRLRFEIERLFEFFTWTQIRYGLAYNPLSAAGLGLCVGLTVGLLISHSRHIVFGLSVGERQRLEKLLLRIRQQGPAHPFWRWIDTNKGDRE